MHLASLLEQMPEGYRSVLLLKYDNGYSTKEISGSFKHSLSTVPLWGTSAYVKPLPPAPSAPL